MRWLDEALAYLAGDSQTRVVIVAAEGPVFSSGHDLRELIGRSEEDYQAVFEACSRMMQRLRGLPQPVIARVQGPALAAGCQLVASCDLAVASTSATFSTPGVKIGLFCTTPMVPLVRAIAPKPAFEMLLTGEPIPAERALHLGLVNRVVPPEWLDDEVEALVTALLAVSPEAIRRGKQAFYEQLTLSETDAYERANACMVRDAREADAQEGITAFFEKRSPRWSS